MSKAKRRTTTKTSDAALMRLGAILHQQIEAAYPHWREYDRLQAPYQRALDRLRSQPGDFDDKWLRMEAARGAFDRTAVGKKANREFEAFNVADALSHKTARAIMRRQPQTIAGAAVFSLAAFCDDGEWGGFGWPADGAGARIVLALSRAAGIKLPNGVRQAVRQ